MAGEGALVASLGLAGNVLFVGYLDRRQGLGDCYRAADVLAGALGAMVVPEDEAAFAAAVAAVPRDVRPHCRAKVA